MIESHTDEAHEAISAELVACTLGQRHRPELHSHIYDPLTDRYGPINAEDLVRGAGIEPAPNAV